VYALFPTSSFYSGPVTFAFFGQNKPISLLFPPPVIATSMDLFTTGRGDLDVAVPSELSQLFDEGDATVTPWLPTTELEQGGASPVYSDTSSDSGVIASLADEDQFLAGLFGADFPLCSGSSTQTTLPLTQPVAASMPGIDPVPEVTAIKKEPEPKCVEKNRKNAEAARQNRQKKKKYLESLEHERISMKAENVVLKTKCRELQENVKKLNEEVAYLKSVLENQSTLASLIQNIPNAPNVKLTSSFARKRPNEGGRSVGTSVKRARKDITTGGVCLHVSKDVVSLEFCASCSKQAVQC